MKRSCRFPLIALLGLAEAGCSVLPGAPVSVLATTKGLNCSAVTCITMSDILFNTAGSVGGAYGTAMFSPDPTPVGNGVVQVGWQLPPPGLDGVPDYVFVKDAVTWKDPLCGPIGGGLGPPNYFFLLNTVCGTAFPYLIRFQTTKLSPNQVWECDPTIINRGYFHKLSARLAPCKRMS